MIRLACAALAAFALAGCGGSSSDSAGLEHACADQRQALAALGRPVGLRGASQALNAVVAMDSSLLRAVHDDAIRARINRLDVSAKRALASINSDPDRSMSPLRTGAADGRRLLSAARNLLAAACA